MYESVGRSLVVALGSRRDARCRARNSRIFKGGCVTRIRIMTRRWIHAPEETSAARDADIPASTACDTFLSRRGHAALTSPWTHDNWILRRITSVISLPSSGETRRNENFGNAPSPYSRERRVCVRPASRVLNEKLKRRGRGWQVKCK